MEPEPHWTVRQMVKVAVELGVPLHDHKGTLGLEELSEGRLAYDPASRLVARRKLRSSAVAYPVVSAHPVREGSPSARGNHRDKRGRHDPLPRFRLPSPHRGPSGAGRHRSGEIRAQ
jgi:hypothetical protein